MKINELNVGAMYCIDLDLVTEAKKYTGIITEYGIDLDLVTEAKKYTGIITEYGIEYLFTDIVLNYSQVTRLVTELPKR